MSDKDPTTPPNAGNRPAGADWTPFRPGIDIKHLFKHPRTGYEIVMLRYAPGAGAPLHRHVGDEHVHVLEGSQSDERGRYPAGSYIYNAAGTTHSVRSDEGCLVLIHWLAPVEFL